MNRFLALLALLMFAMTGAWAAGGTDDEEDPFDEGRRLEDFVRMGGNLAEEQDIEFLFMFTDRYETRAEHAQQFANKLRQRGYPKASFSPAQPEWFANCTARNPRRWPPSASWMRRPIAPACCSW